MATPVLEMQNVEKNFGGVRAIDNFSVMLEPGKIHGLIGPNGAGKTTIFNNITGIYAPVMLLKMAARSSSTARISPAARPIGWRSWVSAARSRISACSPTSLF